jgi:hypothetical protein
LPKLGLNMDYKWSKSRGPIAAVICTLYEAGWKPISPSKWLAKDKVAHVDRAAFSRPHILTQLQKDLICQL